MEFINFIVKAIVILSIMLVFADIALYIAVKKKDKRKIINCDFKEADNVQPDNESQSSLRK